MWLLKTGLVLFVMGVLVWLITITAVFDKRIKFLQGNAAGKRGEGGGGVGDGEEDDGGGDGDSPPPTPDEYNCANGNFIDSDLVCNGNDDCKDGSDEKDCDANCDEEKMFKCSNKKCIEQDLICNGNNDCGDGSDERKKFNGIMDQCECITKEDCDSKTADTCFKDKNGYGRTRCRCANHLFACGGEASFADTCIAGECSMCGKNKKCEFIPSPNTENCINGECVKSSIQI